jgi:nicotinamide mononucleotide transporter
LLEDNHVTDPVELLATTMTLVCVVLTARQHIWCWPTGLVAVILYAYTFYEAKLYSDFGLQIFYVFMQIYGWYYWLYGGRQSNAIRVTQQTALQNAAWITLALGGTLGLGYTMATLTDASLPYADAFTTVAALIAQWLLARKKLESWLFWIVIDIVCVRNYWIKQLGPTTLLYTILLGLAIWGFFVWWKSMSESIESNQMAVTE